MAPRLSFIVENNVDQHGNGAEVDHETDDQYHVPPHPTEEARMLPAQLNRVIT
jgi:hypothetical protein